MTIFINNPTLSSDLCCLFAVTIIPPAAPAGYSLVITGGTAPFTYLWGFKGTDSGTLAIAGPTTNATAVVTGTGEGLLRCRVTDFDGSIKDAYYWIGTAVEVQSIVAGDGIDVDNTDPENPIISNTGVLGLIAGAGISIDNTDPQLPIIELDNDIVNVKVSLTAAQVKTLQSVPVNIGLPASGAGFYYRVTSFDGFFTFNAIPFSVGIILIGCTSILDGITGDAQMSMGGVLGAIANANSNSNNNGGIITFAANDTISITATTDSVLGDGTIVFYITVQKVQV